MTTPVNDSTSHMTDIHDIKSALAFGSQWPWWLWVALALAVTALVGLAWWLRRRQRQPVEQSPSEPILPPDVEAFQQLDILAARGNDNPKLFYFSLSAILRRYVERRYDFPAAEMTTEELLPQIQHLNLSAVLANDVTRFCRRSDPIKFADAPVSQAKMSKDLAFVRQLVEQTTPSAMAVEDQNSEYPPEPVLKTASPKQLPHVKESAKG